jgi:hypothetical protein
MTSFLDKELKDAQLAGHEVSLVTVNQQTYVLALNIQAPRPPWGESQYRILVAIPEIYDLGAALDAFYLEAPYVFNNGHYTSHPRVGNSGQPLVYDGKTWLLVSWHYTQPWQPGKDNLLSHLLHCRGFFSKVEVQ